MTKFKKKTLNCDKTKNISFKNKFLKKRNLVRTLHLNGQFDVLRTAFCDLAMFPILQLLFLAETLPSIACTCPDKFPLHNKLNVGWLLEKLMVRGEYFAVEIHVNKYLQLKTVWGQNVNRSLNLFIEFFTFWKVFPKM